MRKIRDPELLDRLQAVTPQPFSGTLWRMARAGRDPLLASSPRGRWDDGSFEVLYTATQADGARAEMFYHLSRGQPVFPSGLKVHLHELQLEAGKVLVFPDLQSLAPFGVSAADYGSLAYARLQAEYSVTQNIGEAAHFLGADGLLVPGARWPAANLVMLSHRAKVQHVRDHGPQDLRAWARAHQAEG